MMKTRTLKTRSLDVHLREAGEDHPGEDPVILLHGFPQTSHMWRHQLDALSDRFKIYAPDTRGYGGTEKPRVRLDRGILARDVIDLMDALEIESARLVGHDWGGVIAAAAALKYPDRFSRLGLIDTLVSVWITWGIHGYWFKAEPDAEDFFREHHRAFIRVFILPALFGSHIEPLVTNRPIDASVGSDVQSVHVVPGIGHMHTETVRDGFPFVRHPVAVGITKLHQVR